MDTTELKELEERLLNERARFERMIGELGIEARHDPSEEEGEGSPGESPAELGSELWAREQSLGLMQDFRQRLDDINHALHKIVLGTYGLSEESGKPIPVDRLRAIPWARYTVDEEREVERAAHVG